jgi:signal transduction histidine kinase
MDSSVTRSSRTSRPRHADATGEEEVDRSRAAADLLETLEGLAGPDIARAALSVARALPAEIWVGEEKIRRHLIWIAEACAGEKSATDESGSVITLRRRLVGLIRAEVVAAWADSLPSAQVMLDSLQGLERALTACTPTEDQAFAAELADRGGLDLVVEVAHDMRSPLTSILFLSEILHRGHSGGFKDAQKRQIGIIYSAALGLVGLASDMIELARGGNRLAARDPVPFSVNEVLRGVHDLVRPTAEEKKLDLRIGTLDSEHRKGHPLPLNRVLLNLTTNALKFTQVGSVELSAAAAEGSRVRFSVRDTGPGIPPEAMHTLYQTFRREPSRESGYCFSGTGLGLAICRRLVDAMGSELHVETADGVGTCFSFEIDLPPAGLT